MDPSDSNQSMYEHLAELRTRLMWILLACFIGMAICYNFSEEIFTILRRPIAPYLQGTGLIFTAPMDKFLAHLKISFFGGVVIMFPFIAWQIWRFVAPGLYQKERRYAVYFIFSGSCLFAVGLAFAYFIVFPMAFKFLMTFGGDTDKPMISIKEYMAFFVTTALAFGFAFEMPLILVLLGMMEIISKQFLTKNRRYAIMILAVLAAVITPPDLLSMLMMLLPLWLLFEVAVFIIGIIENNRKKALDAL